MKFRKKYIIASLISLIILSYQAYAQISPGELSAVHSHLEGMSNCTQCHSLGDKVTNEKCLACHSEIKERVDKQKGYHSSAEVRDKSCVICHNDHHGKSFSIIRFEKEKFDHNLAGYVLSGAHSKKKCEDCHKVEFIADQKIKDKKYPTYLGLNTACLTCHADYHQNTLSLNCSECHDYEKFKPATKFDHNKTKFKLAGKHQGVECIKCHKIEIKNNKNFQVFAGIPYSNCTNCHKDMHNGLFGQDCRQCHNEESFHNIQGMVNFDHNKTAYKLEDKHQTVPCKSCHKTASLTDPVKHASCLDCHADYHKGQFTKLGVTPDCSSCHSIKGFTGFSYTIEQHNASTFPLQGAHQATPCFACHKKTEKWNFKEIGIRCSDCHTDIHDTYIDKKYYPESACNNCHSETSWSQINFDHAKTDFALTGAHKNKTCRDCHFIKDNEGVSKQRFSGLTSTCTNCHKDIHAGQFELNGVSDCNQCHEFDNWKATRFDHNKTQFILDGRHKNVACVKCHKPVQVGDLTYVQYKINDFKCEDCHH
jgi:nitrate/TMAO reductase-like tetraheme cytochrome c subunit